MAQNKYYIVSATDGSEHCCSTPMGVYYGILKRIYGVDANSVDEETHQKAIEAASWCEEPCGEEFTVYDDEFTVRIAEQED